MTDDTRQIILNTLDELIRHVHREGASREALGLLKMIQVTFENEAEWAVGLTLWMEIQKARKETAFYNN